MELAWVEHAQGSRQRFAAAALAGALQVAAFPAFELWYLAWVCLAPLAWAVADPRLKTNELVATGWTAGFVAQLGTMGWVYHAARHSAELPALGALGGYLALCAAQGAMYAGWAVLVHHVRARGVRMAFAAPAALVFCEWAFPAVFPTYLASSQYLNLRLIQVLDLGGPLALSFVLALASGVVYEGLASLARRPRRIPVAPLALLGATLGALLLYGTTAMHDVADSVSHCAREARVAVVQAASERRGQADARFDLRRQLEQTAEVIRLGAEIVVWPAASYDTVVRDGTRSLAATPLAGLGRPVLFGGLRDEDDGAGGRRLHSTAFLIDAGGEIRGWQDRRYLLPFKDYVPLAGLFPWLRDRLPHGLGLAPGSAPAGLDAGGLRVGVVLSHEELLPAYVRRVVAVGDPEILVSLSDGWLAKGRGPAIQLALATFRAVEHRRYLVRATPAGLSAVVDPAGRIVASTRLGARANLLTDVGGMSRPTVYGVAGDWPGYCALLLLAAWLRPSWMSRTRREKDAPAPVPPSDHPAV